MRKLIQQDNNILVHMFRQDLLNLYCLTNYHQLQVNNHLQISFQIDYYKFHQSKVSLIRFLQDSNIPPSKHSSKDLDTNLIRQLRNNLNYSYTLSLLSCRILLLGKYSKPISYQMSHNQDRNIPRGNRSSSGILNLNNFLDYRLVAIWCQRVGRHNLLDKVSINLQNQRNYYTLKASITAKYHFSNSFLNHMECIVQMNKHQ